MKKLLKQLLAVTTAIMMAITLLPAMANAEETVRDKGTLQIIKHGKDEKTLLGGAEFTFYKLASITNNAETGWKYAVVDHYKSALGGSTKEKNLNDLPSKTWEEKGTIDSLSVLAESDTSGIPSGLTADDGTEKGKTAKTELPLGVYLVKETTTPSGHVAGEPFIVSIPSTNNYNYGKEGGAQDADGTGTGFVYDIVAAPKNSEVPVEKTADDTSVAIGQTVNYTVNTTIPKYGTEYFYEKDGKKVAPKFEVYDTLSNGLTLDKKSITVKAGDKVIDPNSYTINFENIGEKTFLLSFKSTYLETMEGSQAITITYSAKVNENAVYENGNTAGVKYSNKPGENGEGDPVEKKENVYTYGIDLTKTGDKNDDDKTGLNGAEFTLSSENAKLLTVLINGTKVVVNKNTTDSEVNKKTTDSIPTATYNKKNGKLVFHGLAEGTYTLTETKAPAGYTLLKNPITIVIEAAEDGKIASATVDGQTIGTKKIENGVVPVNIENHSGFTLPGTGGMGTYIFTIGGLVVMAGAVLLLVSSKKKRA